MWNFLFLTKIQSEPLLYISEMQGDLEETKLSLNIIFFFLNAVLVTFLYLTKIYVRDEELNLAPELRLYSALW